MVELKEALENVCDCEYPATADEIRERCKDVEVELRDGTETTLGEILETVDEPPENFSSSDELYNFLMSLAPEGSIGRKYYDDRGSNYTVEDRQEHSM
jgi:hypothetical protein